MPVQKQNHTRLRRKRGRIGLQVKLQNIQKCPKCQSPVVPHTACANCGTYKGKEVIASESK